MARKVIVELVDDYDGRSEAVETIRFALDGADYEIDLSVLNAAALRGVFEKWIPHARKAGRVSKAGSAGKSRPVADREHTRAVRAWARANGLEVASRGRIPAEILEAYNSSLRG